MLVELFKGFYLAGRHVYRAVFKNGMVTVQYPEVRRPQPVFFRGRHRLQRYADGLERCVGCALCAAVCPSEAIYLEAKENEPENRVSPGERYAEIYQIHLLRCIFCGFCEEACPEEAIVMGPVYELASDRRTDFIAQKDDMLDPPEKGFGDYHVYDPYISHVTPESDKEAKADPMGAQFLIYGILYVVAVVGGLMVLFNRDTVKSAMSLVLVMLALAGHYFYMGQEFVGAIQIIVYAGAIMVLFLFVIMLLNMREREVTPWYLRSSRYTGGVLALVFFFLIAFGISTFGAGEVASATARPAPSNNEIFSMLMTKYLVPFLLTSVLLLVAVIGAVVMGRRHDPETGEEYLIDDEEMA